jgi:hypothetical protein
MPGHEIEVLDEFAYAKSSGAAWHRGFPDYPPEKRAGHARRV